MIPFYQSQITCIYCERSFEPNRYNSFKTKDHIIPKTLGGANHIKNYIAACEMCNRLKGGFSLPDFARWLTDPRRKGEGHHLYPLFKKMANNAWKLYNKTSKMHKLYLKNK